MEKLFYESQYIKDFTAEVIDTKEIDRKFHVVLDKTAFFPGGGGQFCDLGSIENLEVIDVYEENGIVYHVTEKKPMKIHKVKCSIDWDRRVDGMQQHLGQHVLSGSFFSLFKANTCGFHLGKDFSTVDIQGILTEEQVREAERVANIHIGENLKVNFITPSRKELKNYKLRRALPNTDEQIRIVEIENLDINACCGVHPSSTIELRLIKIKRWEQYKGATRIEFLAGNRAVEDNYKKDRFSETICRYLHSNEEDSIKAIKNLDTDLKALKEENKNIEAQLQDYQVKEILQESAKLKDITVVNRIYHNEDTKYISKLSSKLTESDNVVSLIAVTSENRANLIFTCSRNLTNISMNDLLKDAITLIDGKGGGSKTLAQGAGKNNSNLDSVIDYAAMKLKNMI
jgi:alanyl-tRNA synthetase